MKTTDLPWFTAFAGLGLMVGSAVALTSFKGGMFHPVAPQVPQKPAKPPLPSAPQSRPTIEVAFLMDTTGSMGGLIQGAKDRIWSMASKLMQGDPQPKLRIALIGYRDSLDDYVVKVHDFTDDMDLVHQNLMAFRAAGGGDTPEAVADALRAAHDLQWSEERDVLRLVYVVGDAPAKPVAGGPDALEWSRRLNQREIAVGAVQCGNMAMTTRAFHLLAEHGGGAFVKVAQDGGMARAPATPYDAEIGELERESMALSTYGGRAEVRSGAERKLDAAAGLAAPSLADRASYFAKRKDVKGMVETDAVDLLADPDKVEQLAPAELPEDLRALSRSEQKAEIQRRAEKSKTLRKRVMKLVEERDAWLRDHEAGEGRREKGLDDHLLEDVAKRSRKVGIAY